MFAALFSAALAALGVSVILVLGVAGSLSQDLLDAALAAIEAAALIYFGSRAFEMATGHASASGARRLTPHRSRRQNIRRKREAHS